MSALLDVAALDVLCPMHLVLSAEGKIVHAGPTLHKVVADLEGRALLDVFEVRRPRALSSVQDLAKARQKKISLRLRDAPHTGLKGVVVPAAPDDGQMILNLSFGISVLDGVRDFALTNADFAATDLAIEMLYLIEAKTAAMEASYRLNTRLHGAKMAAEEQAFTDTLTGLKNRRALDTLLEGLLREGGSLAVMHIDLDYFKAVNDTLGHAAGDYVLKNVAEIMIGETRARDVVARVGGDEFTVLLPDVEDEDVLHRIGRRIIERVEVPVMFEGHECRISASIGTVLVEETASERVDDLLKRADIALYASKNAGRARQTIYSAQEHGTEMATAPVPRAERPAMQ